MVKIKITDGLNNMVGEWDEIMAMVKDDIALVLVDMIKNRFPVGTTPASKSQVYTTLSDVVSEFNKIMSNMSARSATASYPPWQSLHPFTVAKKGHDLPLVETMGLYESVMLDPSGLGSYGSRRSVGVFQSQSPREFNLANVHEFGDRNYPASPEYALASGKNRVVIPQRSFIESTFEENEEDLWDLFKELINSFCDVIEEMGDNNVIRNH